jgi:hypothetical protein
MTTSTHDEVVKEFLGKKTVHLVLIKASKVSKSGPAPPSLPHSPGSRSPPSLPLPHTPVRHSSFSSTGSCNRGEAGSSPLKLCSTPPLVRKFSPTAPEPHKREMRIVKLLRSDKQPFGMKIRSDPNKPGVRVSSLASAGTAAQSGLIFEGDLIVRINGKYVAEASHQAVVAALLERSDVELTLASDLVSTAASPLAPTPRQQAPARRTVQLVRQGSAPIGLRIKVSTWGISEEDFKWSPLIMRVSLISTLDLHALIYLLLEFIDWV